MNRLTTLGVALVADRRDDDATADEVRTAVDEQLTEFGVGTSTLDCDDGGVPHHAGGPGGFGPRGN
ncbi:hypothetical protein [Haloferax volcanii]|uniref:hypothetical protein n=1 Tax=Haloferax volcanii TaxID=2246 RepID=UPI00385A39E6